MAQRIILDLNSGKSSLRAGKIAIFASLSLFAIIAFSDGAAVVSSQTRRRAAATRTPPRYSAFPHDAKAHRIDCARCHKFPSPNWNKVRTGDAAFPDITDYPKHESCVGCHRQQFFRGAQPAICSICHTNPSPRDSSRHPFPNPREFFDRSVKGKTAESDFSISFSHEKHVDIISAIRDSRTVFRTASLSKRANPAEESCVVCHATWQAQGSSNDEYATKPPADLGESFWLKKGTFKSVPVGHTTCFTCHSADTGISPAPNDCATCHKIKAALPVGDFDKISAARMGVADRVTLDLWRRRNSSGKFRHEFTSHADLSCDTCHSVQTMNTLDEATKRVSITSCSMCHVTATVDDGGALNFEVQSRKTNPAFECSKCHVVFGKQPIPASHLKAITEAGGTP